MWSELYSWNVHDAVKSGKNVCALVLDKETPVLVFMSDISVLEYFELQNKNKSVAWYVKEENDGESDGTDE